MTAAEPTPIDNTETAETVTESAEVVDDAPETPPADAEPETFPREYVEELRKENGKHRQRAAEADTLAARLHTELVRATGRLADATDLPYAAEHLDDQEKLTAAIDALLDAKPHLASRTPRGDIGQGNRGGAAQPFSLLDTLKGLV